MDKGAETQVKFGNSVIVDGHASIWRHCEPQKGQHGKNGNCSVLPRHFTMWHIIVAAVSNPPGTVCNVTRFAGVACAEPTPYDAVGVCFSRVHQRPSTHCRRPDPTCEGAQQQVVSALAVSGTGFCTVYEWTWSCAHDRRQSCGDHWCDSNALCLDDEHCACPENMTGDPHWQQCRCPSGRVLNGTACVALPACNETLAPRGDEAPVALRDGVTVLVLVLSIVCAVVCSCAAGCRLAHINNAVAPVQHHPNLMYHTAGRPLPRPP